MERLNELLAILNDEGQRANLSDEEIAAHEQELLALFDDVRAGNVDGITRGDLDVLEQCANGVAACQIEAAARYEAAAVAEARIEELAKAIGKNSDDTEGDDAESDEAPEEAPAADDTPAESDDADSDDDDAEEVVEVEDVPEPVAAAAPRPALSKVTPPADRRPVPARTESPIRALMENRNVTLTELADLMVQAREDFIGWDGQGPASKLRVGRISLDLPEERQLRVGDDRGNSAKIDAVIAGAMDPATYDDPAVQAIVASGGFCAPTPADYTLEQISGAQRPLRDSLPRVGGERGGLRFARPPGLADVVVDTTDNAVGEWTNATDLSPGEATKEYQTPACATIVEVLTKAIYQQLQFGNFGTRAFPEWVQVWIQNTAAAWARKAEGEILDDVSSNSTPMTFARQLGAYRDFLAAVTQLRTAEVNRQRMPADAMTRVWVPAWAVGSFQQDMVREGYNRPEVIDRAKVVSDLRALNANVTFYEDTRSGAGQIVAAQGAGNDMRDLPNVLEWYHFHEGAHVHVDGGTLDLGIVRDGTLVSTNDYRIFSESWEVTGYRGIFSHRVRQTICPDGGAQAASDVAICDSAS